MRQAPDFEPKLHGLQQPELMQRGLDHPHPCNFHLSRVLDRGWGEMAFEYRWDSTTGCKSAEGSGNPDLTACFLYEYTTYADNAGRYADDCYYPLAPPFPDWEFRHPTDGRTAPVALGCFAATQAWAWDRHKLGGRLEIQHADAIAVYTITAIQQYRFHCELCGMDEVIPGPHSGPHPIVRRFEALSAPSAANAAAHSAGSDTQAGAAVWRYSLHKHGAQATMDVDANGYVDDSAHIGFGPF